MITFKIPIHTLLQGDFWPKFSKVSKFYHEFGLFYEDNTRFDQCRWHKMIDFLDLGKVFSTPSANCRLGINFLYLSPMAYK